MMTMTLKKDNYWLSLGALCSTALVNGIMMLQVFPYSGFMVLSMEPQLNKAQVGLYAGALASTFMLGRLITSYLVWGQVADRYGRVLTLQTSLFLSCICCLGFGLATTYEEAIAWRLALGLSNALVATTKVMASELTKRKPTGRNNERQTTSLQEEKKELDIPRESQSTKHAEEDAEDDLEYDRRWKRYAMSLIVGMRSWGYLLGPAIGGWLAEPIAQYCHDNTSGGSSNGDWWLCSPSSSGIIYQTLESYPFLLPNLVTALLCAISLLWTTLCVPETLVLSPKEKTILEYKRKRFWKRLGCLICWNSSRQQQHHQNEQLPLLATSAQKSSNSSTEKRIVQDKRTDGTMNGTKKEESSIRAIWGRTATRQHLLAHWLVSLVECMVDEGFPLFCLIPAAVVSATSTSVDNGNKAVGGLGLNEAGIGTLLSAAGMIFAALQHVIFVCVVDRIGLYPSIRNGCLWGIISSMVIPLSTFMLSSSTQNEQTALPWTTFWLLAIVVGASKIVTCMFFTSIAVATNATVPLELRAQMNGLLVMGSSLAKGLGPLAAGGLITLAYNSPSDNINNQTGDVGWYHRHGASFVVFGTISFLRVLTWIFTWRLKADSSSED